MLSMPDSVALKETYIIRPTTLNDAEAVTALMNLCSIKVIGRSDDSVEDVLTHWQMPGMNLATDHRLVLTPDGRVIGFAEVTDFYRPGNPFIDVYVHPDVEAEAIGLYLMHWCEERARQTSDRLPDDARVALRAATFSSDLFYKTLLENAGLRLIRHQLRMQIELDGPLPEPEWPEGIKLRVFQAGDDERAVKRAHRESFKDHWGYVETPFEEDFAHWRHRWMGERTFDPSLWFLAMDGDQIAGICLCQPDHPSDAEMGWVENLGVLRPYRRQGVGRALLLHAFAEFRRRGQKRVGLGVDADSLTGATRLYEKAGMHTALQLDIYEKELRPGTDLGKQSLDDEE